MSLKKGKSPLLTLFPWYLIYSNGLFLCRTVRDELRLREAISTENAKGGLEKMDPYCTKVVAEKNVFFPILKFYTIFMRNALINRG